MKAKTYITALLAALALVSCTDNSRVKSYGGTANVKLESGRKLVNVTWKSTESTDSLWILTRKAEEGEKPTSYEFYEKSDYGLLEGKYIITETR